MKIGSSIPPLSNPLDAARPRPAAASPQPAGSAEGERVELSALSARLASASAGEAPVNAQKVAEIKQAISEGRFQINPERIADGLLASVREMLGRAGKPA